MSKKEIIVTQQAPQAIGPYSQAIKVGNTVYLSGQIPLDPHTMTLVGSNIVRQTEQVFDNLAAVCQASGGQLHDIVKLTIFLTDLNNFSAVNEVMASYMREPYPARACVQVSALPKGAAIEMDAILMLGTCTNL